ncbi:8026_t:CDS:2, partial [Scutellospora calospora]
MQFNSELIINKLQEEEVEFTRELNKLRKQHDEKVDKLIKQHEEKMKDLIRNFSKDDTIIIPKQEESDMSSLIIENDKAPEDKSNISVIDLEKSLEILCINNTPISVQSTSNLNSYHDLDPDLYDYNGILTYSPSVDTKTVSNILTDFTIIDDDVTSISQASPTRYNALPPRTEPINDNKMPNYQRMSIPELK